MSSIILDLARPTVNIGAIQRKLQTPPRKEFDTTVTRTRNKYLNVNQKARELVETGVLKSEYPFITITTPEQLRSFVALCVSNGEYVLDLETTGLDVFNDKIVGVCLYTPNHPSVYVPLNHTDMENNRLEGQLEESEAQAILKPLVTSRARAINHNIKFDAKFLLANWGYTFNNIYWDTMIAGFLLLETETSHGLKYLYDKYIGKTGDKTSYNDLFDGIPFNFVDLDLASIYGANDGIKTYKLYQFQSQFLNPRHKREDFRQLYHVMADIEMPLQPVLIGMEMRGVEIRQDFVQELEIKYRAKLDELETQLYQMIDCLNHIIETYPELVELKKGNPINLNSPKQMAILFYDVMKFPIVDRKKPRGTGKEQRNLWQQEVKQPNKLKFLETYCEYKDVEKLLSGFLKKIPNAREPKTNAVHTNFNPIGAKTGRFSSSHPIHKINLQQIPSKNKDIRKIFKARDGHVFVGSDFSQIEPRILASISQDESLIGAYNGGRDLYSTMASKIFKKPYEECLEFHPETGAKQDEGKKLRTFCKSILLGIMYGRGAKSIGEQIGESEAVAQQIVDDFYKEFPKVRQLTRAVQYNAEVTGYVATLDGRKRRLPEMQIKDHTNSKYVNATRQCLNAIVQGTSADIMKKSMIEIANHPRFKEVEAQLLLTIHDEVIAEVKREYALEVGEIITDTMKRVAFDMLGVVQKCDVEITEVWSGDDVAEQL